jgi:hypothetical protein
MKVASSLTLYSFSCCTIKYYYYYYNILCYSLAISRVCSFFRSLVSSAFQKKKRKETVCNNLHFQNALLSHKALEKRTHTTLF